MKKFNCILAKFGPRLMYKLGYMAQRKKKLQTPNLDLPGAMSFHLVPHLPRLVAMVAKFFMCDRKVSNLTNYFLVISFLFFSVLLTTKVNNTKC